MEENKKTTEQASKPAPKKSNKKTKDDIIKELRETCARKDVEFDTEVSALEDKIANKDVIIRGKTAEAAKLRKDNEALQMRVRELEEKLKETGKQSLWKRIFG